MRKFTLIISLVVLLVPFIVNANVLYCLNDEQSLPPGCETNPDQNCLYTCDLRSGQGFCQICTTDNGFPGVNPNTCASQTCSFLDGGGGEPDPNAPNLTINEPVDGEVYGSRRIFFDVDVDGLSRIEYRIAGESRWEQMCDNCAHYSRHERVEEGVNDITFRAKKHSNNFITEERIVFSVDSREPDFRKSWPKDGEFANGEFIVEYTEENLDRIELLYKGENENSWTTKLLDHCVSGESIQCDTTLDISPYENGEMNYQFLVCDSANCDEGDITTVKVDSRPPVLDVNDFGVAGFSTKKVPFSIEINEEVDLFYIDNNDPKNKHKRLCNGCSQFDKEVTFKDGIWDITIFAEDEAGNFDSFDMFFTVDTKKPKIRKCEPSRGWANGQFWSQYDETDLQGLSLFYGINGDYQESEFEGCLSGKKQECSIDIDLSAFDGGEIDVYCSITDNFHTIMSKVKSLDVDITDPSFTKFEWDLDRDVLNLDIEVDEVVDVEYMDSASSRPRFKNLCRNKDICKKSKRFKDGSHIVTIRAIDDAGNFDEREINFVI